MITRASTMRQRLIYWGHLSMEPAQEFNGSSSPFGRIQEMGPNAGIHGDGVHYDFIDGVMCKPDGGMADTVDRAGRSIAHTIRCQETQEAIGFLPQQQRIAVIRTFRVGRKEKPRSTRLVAEQMGISHTTVADLISAAIEDMVGRIYGRWELLAVDDSESEKQAAA